MPATSMIADGPSDDTKRAVDKCNKGISVDHLYQDHCVAMAYSIGGDINIIWEGVEIES